MYVYVQVECEYLKKARGTVTATARYQLPADKQVHKTKIKNKKGQTQSRVR